MFASLALQWWRAGWCATLTLLPGTWCTRYAGLGIGGRKFHSFGCLVARVRTGQPLLLHLSPSISLPLFARPARRWTTR